MTQISSVAVVIQTVHTLHCQEIGSQYWKGANDMLYFRDYKEAETYREKWYAGKNYVILFDTVLKMYYILPCTKEG